MTMTTFAEWCHAHNVAPIEPLPRACKLSMRGRTQIYELARAGRIRLVKVGSRTGVAAEEIFRLVAETKAATEAA